MCALQFHLFVWDNDGDWLVCEWSMDSLLRPHAQVLSNFLEKARHKPRKSSHGRLRGSSGCSCASSISCCRHGFDRFGNLIRPHFLRILELLIGADGKPLKGFVVRQTLDNNFIRHVIRNTLNKLIHGARRFGVKYQRGKRKQREERTMAATIEWRSTFRGANATGGAKRCLM